MRFCLLLIIVFISDVVGIHGTANIPQSIEDYYWRDYYGLIPTDAIPGGVDQNGSSTFLGQFSASYNSSLSRIDLLTATIRRGSSVAFAPYRSKTIYSNETDTNVKVLCGGYTSRYKWYLRTAQFPINCRTVISGYENSPLYIGRATVGREVITGKIFADPSNHGTDKLIIPLNGGEGYPESYEILTYCP